MNRSIKDATVKRYFYDTHNQLKAHLIDFKLHPSLDGTLRPTFERWYPGRLGGQEVFA